MSSNSAAEGKDHVLCTIEKRIQSTGRDLFGRSILSSKERRQLEGLDHEQHEESRFERVHSLMSNDLKARNMTGLSASAEERWKSEDKAEYHGWQPGKTAEERARDIRLEPITYAIFGDLSRDKKTLRKQKKVEELKKLRDLEKLQEEVLKKLNWLYRVPVARYQPVPIKESHPQFLPAVRGKLSRASRKPHSNIRVALDRRPPQYLYRTTSWQGRPGSRSTNGHDEIHFHLPAAYKNGAKEEIRGDGVLVPSLDDEPNALSELVEKLGRRLLWDDRRRDPTLSWTSSLLFALVHATGRLAKKQKHIGVHVVATSQVRTLNGIESGRAVEFLMAQDLLHQLNIADWNGWSNREHYRLQRPWYTHEWLTHHAVWAPPGRERFAYEANIEELIDVGLYDLVPHLKTKAEENMKGLYDRCVYTRSVGHTSHAKPEEIRAFTEHDLELAEKLAKCFRWEHRYATDTITGEQKPERGSGTVVATSTPHLNIFFDLLSMEARPQQDPMFMQWIRDHFTSTYPYWFALVYRANSDTAADFASLDFAGLARLANNLPEQAQSLDLARDALLALSLPDSIPPTRVWCADEDFNWYCKWLHKYPRPLRVRLAKEDKKKKSGVAKELIDHITGQSTEQQGQTQDENAIASEETADNEITGADQDIFTRASNASEHEADASEDPSMRGREGEDGRGHKKSEAPDESGPDGEPATKRQKLSHAGRSGEGIVDYLAGV